MRPGHLKDMRFYFSWAQLKTPTVQERSGIELRFGHIGAIGEVPFILNSHRREEQLPRIHPL